MCISCFNQVIPAPWPTLSLPPRSPVVQQLSVHCVTSSSHTDAMGSVVFTLPFSFPLLPPSVPSDGPTNTIMLSKGHFEGLSSSRSHQHGNLMCVFHNLIMHVLILSVAVSGNLTLMIWLSNPSHIQCTLIRVPSPHWSESPTHNAQESAFNSSRSGSLSPWAWHWFLWPEDGLFLGMMYKILSSYAITIF
jgi:hypothetical protein